MIHGNGMGEIGPGLPVLLPWIIVNGSARGDVGEKYRQDQPDLHCGLDTLAPWGSLLLGRTQPDPTSMAGPISVAG